MAPFDGIVDLPENLAVYALAAPGQQYAVYLCHTGEEADTATSVTLTLDLSQGTYRAEWIDTLSCERSDGESFAHGGGPRALASPAFAEDLALRLLSE